MKIIVTVPTYYPLKDGVQFVTQYQAEGLTRLGYEVVVVTPKFGNSLEDEVHNGVRILRPDIKTIHALYIGDKHKYRNLIIDLTFDADVLINVCTQTATTDLLYPILDRIKCKKILYMHGMISFKWERKDFTNISIFAHKFWNNIKWGYLYKTSKRFFRKYNHITQLHRFDKGYQFFEKEYSIKSEILENAAADDFFNKKIVYSLKLPKVYMLCVANYLERKNQKMLLIAFYRSCIDKNIELVLIGSEKNTYYNDLIGLKKNLDNKFGERKVQILYNVPRSHIPEYVKRASIYLMSSTWEAFPISIVESMASGIPFITTDVGCVKYLPGGIVINDLDEMIFWIELLSNNFDLCKMLGEIGENYAKKNLTIDHKVSQLINLLEN